MGRLSWDEVREWHDIYTLPNVKLIASGIGKVGGRRKREGIGDICMPIADSLCYTAETNTTL